MPDTDVPRFPRQLILGHRGSPRVATENTLASFAAALKAGADGVELDVRRSSDGVPVVIHDDDLDRTMHARGAVSRLRWGGIQRITAAQVPSLEQAVAWAAASGAWLNIELKSPGVEEAVLQLVHAAGISQRTVFSSFDREAVRRVGEIDGEAVRFYLTEAWNDSARRNYSAASAMGVCLRVDASTPQVLEQLHSMSIPVIVWTVNDPATMRRLILAGVAAIITDLPEIGVRVREECER